MVNKFQYMKILERAQKAEREAIKKIFDLGDGIEISFVEIPKGKFMMGSEDYKDQMPIHEVTFEEPFYMSQFLVTQEQFNKVMDYNPSYYQGPKRPVESVSFNEAMEFCKKISEKIGYECTLPSEAQWEYACRAGTTTKYHFGDEADSTLCHCYPNTETCDVGKYPCNDWALYDMHGNVWEWVADDYHPNYEGAPTDGSAWID